MEGVVEIQVFFLRWQKSHELKKRNDDVRSFFWVEMIEVLPLKTPFFHGFYKF